MISLISPFKIDDLTRINVFLRNRQLLKRAKIFFKNDGFSVFKAGYRQSPALGLKGGALERFRHFFNKKLKKWSVLRDMDSYDSF